jgi:hypothetical protein
VRVCGPRVVVVVVASSSPIASHRIDRDSTVVTMYES